MIDRQALHCSEMRFDHPVTREPIKVIAPLPDDMNRLIEHLRETL
jgi:23S rRNA-/tRNA-specific pseudouridylate synthase